MLTGMILSVYSSMAIAQCLEQKLVAPDAAAIDSFGSSVALDGDTAIVGVPGDDCADGPSPCGSAFVYRFDGTSWVERQKLTASIPDSFAMFGASVSVSGNTALVGAPLARCAIGIHCGAVYVFNFDGTSWVEEQKLVISDADTRRTDEFGRSVSLSGNTAIMGVTWGDCVEGIDCASAYVFRFNGTLWVEEQKLIATDMRASGFFRTTASVDGNVAVVGAGYDAGAEGSAYVYEFNGTHWVEVQRLTDRIPSGGNFFGISVSASGDRIVVGRLRDTELPSCNCGAVYTFRFNGTDWVEEQMLLAPRADTKTSFGFSVSLRGESLAVGAYKDNCADGDECGSAYAFRFTRNSWVQTHRLTAFDAGAGDWLGRAVSLRGDTVVVGATRNDCAAGSNCGAAYLFSCLDLIVTRLDIVPGSCPNMVDPRSTGVVPVAVVGSLDFDVAAIDTGSLTLARADGVGGSVLPLLGISGRRGPGIVMEDVATPFLGDSCGCHALGGDGIDDLSLEFSTSAMSREFQLNAPRGRGPIRLVLRGTLQDGTRFEGVDCIALPRRSRFLRR